MAEGVEVGVAKHNGETAPEGGAAQSSPKHRAASGVLHWLGEAVLTLLAVLGAVSIVAVIVAYAFGINIMMFKTGSMSPEIPAGSVALVREIPAAEAEVGDVITVERPGQLPITHRLIANEPDPDNPPMGRILNMQGDDNPQPDPFPYHVKEVKLLFWSHPEGGHYVARLTDPRVLGVVTVLVAAVVTWSFWPRNSESKGPKEAVASRRRGRRRRTTR